GPSTGRGSSFTTERAPTAGRATRWRKAMARWSRTRRHSNASGIDRVTQEAPMKTLLALTFAAVTAAPGMLLAHHAWPVSNARLVTVKGTVTDFAWSNPHPMITVQVKTEDGQTETWMVGGPAINRMEANGW